MFASFTAGSRRLLAGVGVTLAGLGLVGCETTGQMRSPGVEKPVPISATRPAASGVTPAGWNNGTPSGRSSPGAPTMPNGAVVPAGGSSASVGGTAQGAPGYFNTAPGGGCSGGSCPLTKTGAEAKSAAPAAEPAPVFSTPAGTPGAVAPAGYAAPAGGETKTTSSFRPTGYSAPVPATGAGMSPGSALTSEVVAPPPPPPEFPSRTQPQTGGWNHP